MMDAEKASTKPQNGKKTKIVVKRRKVVKRRRKVKPKKINSMKNTHSFFVFFIICLSAVLLYQQMRLVQRQNSFMVELPWKMEFELGTFMMKEPRVFGNFTKNRNLPLPDPILKLCKECEDAVAFDNFHCKRRIIPWLKHNVTMEALEAGQLDVSQQFTTCKPCHPTTCSAEMHVHLRFDEAAPKVYRAVTHDLPSIPSRHRIPDNMLNLLQAYFKDWNGNKPEVFFAYNPSVVRLPKKTEISVPGAAYLATYRVSPSHACGFATYNFTRRKLDLLGVALLDTNLTIIPDTNDVFDLNKHTEITRSGSTFRNFKLVEFNSTFWLTDNDLVAQIRVRTPGFGAPKGRKRSLLRYLIAQTGLFFQEERKPRARTLVSHIFGKGDVELSLPTGVHGFNVKRGTHNLFQDSSGDTYIEILPYKSRHTALFNPSKSRVKGGVYISDSKVKDSFETDEFLLRRQYFLGMEYGGACCVNLDREFYADLITNSTILQYPDLRLGISSRRTKRQIDHEGSGTRQFLYLSRLYAFIPEAPFDIVATSGMFCFGLASEDEMEGNLLAKQTVKRNPLTIMNDVYNCPAVHVATGITEKAGDDDRVIVSYGVNDCVPRVVELDKRDLAYHLFAPLSDLSYLVDKYATA